MATVVDVGQADPVASVGVGYRPHLDGLRAVAVYLVVLFHAGADRFTGGFIGVDVFFVLSGYLVTQLLARDLDAFGKLRFGRFYARRMRRLLPASAAALLVTAIVYSAVAAPAEIATSVNSFKAAFLYVANWFFIHRSTDYFAANADTNPVTHFWSLAVEEQFYLLWPVLLGTLFVATRRLRDKAHRAMQISVAIGAVISVVWALRLSGTNLNRAYYGTDARAYQLLAGALLALSPGLMRRASRYRSVLVAAPLAVAALLVLSTSLLDMNAIRRGIATTIVTVVLIGAIESARGGPVNRVLACGPMVYLGKISYGTYLWHWPVIVVMGTVLGGVSPDSTFAISALVATALASLSYHLLERPIREQKLLDRINPVVIGVGLIIGIVSALVIVPYVLDPYRAHAEATAEATHTGFTPTPSFDFKSARTSFGTDQLNGLAPTLQRNWDCVGKPASACTIVKGGRPRILLLGDSHAWMMFPTFTKLAQAHNLTFSKVASGSCPWQRNIYYNLANAGGQARLRQCQRVKPDFYERVLPALKPDLVIVVSVDYLSRDVATAYDDNNKPIHTNSPAEYEQLMKADTERSVSELREFAAKVLIVEPFPTNADHLDPLACLSKSKVLEDCRFVADSSLTKPMEDIYRGVADNKHVYVADFDKLLCPYYPICDPVIDGDIVRFDQGHITPKFALTLVDPITAFLRNDGLLKGG